ncbi:hypothetical protein MTR67_019676 [Solanum verrucosum]|uniref:Uncharacterized protein n=1 Tax=Solanum verrucosum TaxID=315347 RepID=A0AAF0QTA9_SOLVR|nr:hypothetical protein MTR67_019676 [Solanum verrucosum]
MEPVTQLKLVHFS